MNIPTAFRASFRPFSRPARRAFSLLTALCLAAFSPAQADTLTTIHINEVDSDTPGALDAAEFVELYGTPNGSLDGLVLVFFNGDNELAYRVYDLDGFSLDANGFFLLGNASVPGVDYVIPDNTLQNGADAVALYRASTFVILNWSRSPGHPDGPLLDSIVYDTDDADDTGLIDAFGVIWDLPSPVQYNENENGLFESQSISRSVDGGSTIVIQDSTPGAPNSATIAPLVSSPTSADITATTATLGGNVTAAGGSAITERGVVYSLTSANADPLISGSGVTKVIASGTDTGVFTVPVTGLAAGEAYSFKAYAANSLGTNYTGVATFTFAPEIAVEQPAGTDLASGAAGVAFGTVVTGNPVVRSFTVKNTGAEPLTLGAISITGTNAGDFSVTALPASPVAATNGSTTFAVMFRPGAAGARSATLNLPNNDTTGGENPFVIALTGSGTDTAVIASSYTAVTGGQLVGSTFTIGMVGGDNPGNNWPAAESPDKAVDGDVNTKFLIFQSNGAGLVLTPSNATVAYNRLALTTAGDAPERDPASYVILGSTTALPTSGTIATNTLALIQQGTLALHTDRGVGPHVVQFANSTAYASYLVVFPTVRSTAGNNLTQIAEVQLSQGVSVPNQVMMGKARGGRLVVSSFNLGLAVTDWPAGESPDHALDGGASSKFLFNQNNGAGFIVAPEAGSTVINSLSFWTANDAAERDPLTYKVYGSSGPATGFAPGSHGVGSSPWTLIQDTTPVTLPPERNTGPTTVTFPNTTAYASYLVVFPAVKNSPSTSLTQIAEVAFAYVPPLSNLTHTYLAGSDVPVTRNDVAIAGGSTATLSLGYAPDTGTELMIVRNTGLGFINGTYGNLAQGQTVSLTFGGVTYDFVANYYGGTGNDLVLAWKNTRIMAWGYNVNGQVGDGSTTNRLLPVPVTASGVLAGKTVMSVASSTRHSLALCSDGTVAAWGDNTKGRLGDGTTTSSSVPVAVVATGVLAGKQVIAVAAGLNHSLALCSDGTVAAWGSNLLGHLGNSGATDSSVPVAVTTSGVLLGKTVVAISAGNDHCLAICSDGAVVAWGSNYDGQLGIGSTPPYTSNVPVLVSTSGILAGKSVTSISASDLSSLALCSDGTVAAWGRNAEGQLGDGTTTLRLAPVDITTSGVLVGKTVISIVSGSNFGVALCLDGSLASWGWNGQSALGNGTSTPGAYPVPAAVTSGVLSGKTVVTVSAGAAHNLALCTDGTLAGWGVGSLGRLGNGFETTHPTPIEVSQATLGAGERFAKIFVMRGALHSLALVAAPAVPPATAPGIASPTSADITATTATLGGDVTSDGGDDVTEVGVVFSLTSVDNDPNIGEPNVTKVPATILSGVGGFSGVFTVPVTGLASNSGYSFKAYAINSVGTTYTAPVATFATLPPPATAPGIASPTSADITATTATLGGNVTADGGAPVTERGVVFSLTSADNDPNIGDPNVTQVTVGGVVISTVISGVFTVPVTGLAPNSGYSFKAYAKNSVGTTYTAPVATFATLPPPATAPVVASPTSADITATTATLGGNVTSDGGDDVTEFGVVFSLTSSDNDPNIGEPNVTKVPATFLSVDSGFTGVFTVPVTGLAPDSGYSFKAYAINGVGTSYSSPAATFNTIAEAAAETVSIGGSVVLSVPEFGPTRVVPDLLTGQVVIRGAFTNGLDDVLSLTLPLGKAVTGGTLTVTDYVQAPMLPSAVSIQRQGMGYSSATPLVSANETQVYSTNNTAVAALTRCGEREFTLRLAPPAAMNFQVVMIPTGPPGSPLQPMLTPIGPSYGNASYEVVLEIGDAATDATLTNLNPNGTATLDPAFLSGTAGYSATIPNSQSQVYLTATMPATAHATVSLNLGSTNTVRSASANFAMAYGLNTLKYEVCAQDGVTKSTYIVNITREVINPTFPGYSFTVPANTQSTIDKAKILALAADSDGGTLDIEEFSTLSAQNNLASYYEAVGGSVIFRTTDPYFTGADSFPITITDGQGGSVTGLVSVTVLPYDGPPSGNRATIMAMPGGVLDLVFHGIPGRSYLVQRSPTLVNPVWETLDTVTAGPDGRILFTDPTPPPTGFYRTVEDLGG